MGERLDSIPFSGIMRIRDMMFGIENPYRLDQGDVGFDAPDAVKTGMSRAIAENRTHYVQTVGIPRLRELIVDKLQNQNKIPIESVDDVMVTNGGIHGLYVIFHGLLEPGDEVLCATQCGHRHAVPSNRLKVYPSTARYMNRVAGGQT